VHISELRPLSRDDSSVQLEVLCSKGTYVRTLAEDIAKALGTCGHVESLRRLYVEPFNQATMETLESVGAAVDAGKVPPILPPDAPLQHLAAVTLGTQSTAKLLQGQPVAAADCSLPGRVRLYSATGTFLGLGESDGAGNVRPRRLFTDAQ